MLFSKKWLRNHPQFLLHFLIHIEVLMLCRKFELIPIQDFQIMVSKKMKMNIHKRNRKTACTCGYITVCVRLCVHSLI